jgi:polyhydroxyalkanoate synthesis regulator phasin
MVIISCPTCNKTFQRQGHLVIHLNKKFKCKPKINNQILNSITHTETYTEHTKIYNGQNLDNITHTQQQINSTISHIQSDIKEIPPKIEIKRDQHKNNNINNKVFQCVSCLKTLSDANSLRRHKKQYCKVKRTNDEIKQLEERVKKLEDENKKNKNMTIEEAKNIVLDLFEQLNINNV